jgi:Cu(I)/Ag(I) efflux system membrane fusion protein
VRFGKAVAALAVVLTAGAGGIWLTRPELLRFASHTAQQSVAPAHSSVRALYYRDPDGKAAYSLAPATTSDGRAYVAVMPGDEKLSFDTGEEPAQVAGGKIKFYRNPMGLPDYSPVPKKDSMGMDYIPVYEDETPDDGTVKLAPGKIQRSGVKSEPASRQIIRSVIRAPGTIQIDERRVSVISMRSEGYIQKVADVTTGSRVRKGDPLMEVYVPAITNAAADYVATMRGPGERLGAGARQRLQNFNVPDAVLAAIERDRTAPLAIEWTAPRDGIVLERKATEGMRVDAGETVFRLADISLVWILIDVAERDIGRIQIGQSATATARAYPGRTFEGKVTVIYPQMNRETRTARVRIELPNADLALLPDMYVDAEVGIGKAEAVVAVPDSAVLDSGQRQVVLVDKGEGKFEPRDVVLGFRAGGWTEIREGIADGDLVVTSANFLIDAESNLNAALKGYAASGAPQ